MHELNMLFLLLFTAVCWSASSFMALGWDFVEVVLRLSLVKL